MTSISCSQCGMKLTVKAEFAGRSSKCPTCQQALVVPEQTQSYVPSGVIEGTVSTLAKAGVEGSVLLQQAATVAGQKSLTGLLGQRSEGRYLIESEIARGGMGVVLRAVDCDIRREVAVKFLLDQTDATKKTRFVEEAQITGQLEHPNIVPVHEMGLDEDKQLFFTMKMVKGRSLAQILDEQRKIVATAGKGEAKEAITLPRFLSIFVSICNALAYAHSRGVVHRDLKPANIMVGDFGEVYVMDWGLAKIMVRHAPPTMTQTHFDTAPVSKSSSKIITSREPDTDLTQEGAILGTPVYMPPEQAQGKISEIDARSDVYSLGAILYEMLALEPPIDRRGGFPSILKRVVKGEIAPPEQRLSRRANGAASRRFIPMELSAIAMKALSKKREDRYPSVAAMRLDIERFLEGRSVSAKEDTYREVLWKLMRRNTGALSIVLLGVVFILGYIIDEDYKKIRELRQNVLEVKQAAAETRDLTSLRALRILDLDLRCAQLPDLAPIKGMPLTALQLYNSSVTSLTPLKGMPLKKLTLWDCGQLADLAPLEGMLLIQLELGRCPQIKDLSPLRGMPLTQLNLENCALVSDLAPLEGMLLTQLFIHGCHRVKDLAPLNGMSLEEIYLTPRSITKSSMEVLRQMESLKTIGLARYKKFPAEEFWKRYDAGEFK